MAILLEFKHESISDVVVIDHVEQLIATEP